MMWELGMAKTLFWLCALAAVWSYFIYPAVLWAQLRLRAAPPKRPISVEAAPRLSLIVTVYNEEARIEQKLRNIAELDYPRDSFEVLIASDCSTDGTDAIVMAQQDQRIRLVRASERLGKENAQLSAIRVATGQILVFSDVATQMPADALLRLVPYFEDPAVGAVSSEDRFIAQDGKVAGEGLYVRYEMWLRRLESSLAGLVGLSGSFFAARRGVCEYWDIQSPSDFNTALNCARHGLRAVSAPDVLGYYQDLKDSSREYARKVRTVLRGMTGLSRHMEVMNPAEYGQFAFQIIGHKVMRWAVPVALVLLLLLNLLLLGEGALYGLILLCQIGFYAAAMAAFVHPPLREWGFIRIIYFFVQVNVAIADALWQFLRGTRMTVWQPSAR
jgi:glycosyltransferase involved in cell wall biosynthesis